MNVEITDDDIKMLREASTKMLKAGVKMNEGADFYGEDLSWLDLHAKLANLAHKLEKAN